MSNGRTATPLPTPGLLAEPNRFGAPGVVERWLGWMLSVAGLLLFAGTAWPALPAASQHPPWWNAGGVAIAALIMLLALFGLVLPMRALTAIWAAVPLGLSLLSATAFAPRDGVLPTDPNAWPWAMFPTAYGYLTLLVFRAIWAFVGPVVLPLLTVASAQFFLGEIPPDLAALVPIRISEFIYTVFFLMMRRRLLRLHAHEQRARDAGERRARAEVELQRHNEVSRFVHDHVLSVLNAAIALQGASPAALRTEAGIALGRLNSTERVGEPDDTWLAFGVMANRLEKAWRRIDPRCPISLDVGLGEVPFTVAAAIEDASCEALRNSVYHAGARASRTIEARLLDGSVDVLVRDDGLGFDVAAVPGTRMGVRESILARTRGVGGDASVVSRVGGETTVNIRWPG
ncbi:hypothetical protein [Micropruina sp.]|uniref:sensor histidine kinase n=1 Tax=Micropruina sp. TaxID=2737536 RepID=UPI0039E4BD0A